MVTKWSSWRLDHEKRIPLRIIDASINVMEHGTDCAIVPAAGEDDDSLSPYSVDTKLFQLSLGRDRIHVSRRRQSSARRIR